MVQIESAYYGDEKSFTNITNSLLSKISNGSIETVVNSSLKPQFETTTGAALTGEDEKEVTRRATIDCGTPADTKCMDAAKLRIRQQMLREKEAEATSGANMIKGNRLTVDVIDETGQRKQIVVPENQTFKLSGIASDIPQGKDQDSLFPSGSVFYRRLWEYVGTLVGVLVYALGILVPYALFMREAEKAIDVGSRDTSPKKSWESNTAYALRIAGPGGSYKAAAYGTAVLSAVVPYSGLVVAVVYYAGKTFINEYQK